MMRSSRPSSALNQYSSFLALCLAAMHGLPPVDCAPNPSPLLGSNWGNPRRYIHLQTTTDMNNFYLEISLSGQVRKSTSRGSYSVILLKAQTRQSVAILGVKSNRYLCMDLEGNLFSSHICNEEDCLFNHELLENRYDVYYSTRNGMLVNLDRAKQVYIAGQNLPSSALFLPETNTIPLERLLHRGKRNRPTNPDDPYNTNIEASDSRALPEEPDQEPEPELEAGHVSRENPLSPNDDDPWNTQTKSVIASPRGEMIMG
ncbi:fibroblast growth factor 23 [Engraulis encrasicolus]|uniref:fibroblast growth factor 23 n=1 Tax=Engraulis encrasicolus TaxID=184585 RepID=UPI002FD63D6C